MDAPAGLAVVEDIVRRELDAQERRADAADTRAGLVLGFAGLVVSVGGDGWLPLAVASRVVAAGAGVVALSATSVRTVSSRHVEAVRRAFVNEPPLAARVAILDLDVTLSVAARVRYAKKLAHLRLASGLLVIALALSLAGTTVEVIA